MFVRWGRTKVTFLKFPRALVAAPELYDDIVAHVGNSDGLLVSEGGRKGRVIGGLAYMKVCYGCENWICERW